MKFVKTIQNNYDLGESKFNINGTACKSKQYVIIDTGIWCRPQTDGPGLTAAVLMRFANAYLDAVGDITYVISELYDSEPRSTTAIKRALDYIITNWQNENSCDLWEEMMGGHF